MTLTKEAITRSVFDRLAMSKAASAKAVEATFEIIKKTLEAGENVLISGFGKLFAKDKGKRRRRNLGTGKDLMLAERRFVTFGRCAMMLKSNLDGGQDQCIQPPARVKIEHIIQNESPKQMLTGHPLEGGSSRGSAG